MTDNDTETTTLIWRLLIAGALITALALIVSQLQEILAVIQQPEGGR